MHAETLGEERVVPAAALRRSGWRRVPGWLRPILALLALALVSLLVVGSPYRYAALAPLPEMAGVSDLASWGRAREGVEFVPGATPLARLQGDEGRFVYLYRNLLRLQEHEALRVSAELRGEGLRGGHLPGGAGQLVAVSLDDRHRRIAHWPNRVGGVDGDGEWRPVSLVIPIAGQVAAIQVIALVMADGGAMELRDLRVESVVERRSFTLGRWLLLAGWALAWLWCARALLAPGARRLERLLVLIAGSLALAVALAPPADVDRLARQLLIGGQDAVYELASLIPADAPSAADQVAAASGVEPHAGAVATTDAAGGATHGEEAGEGAATGSAAVSTSAAGEGSSAPAASGAGHGEQRRYWMPRGRDVDKRAHLTGFALLALLAAFAFRNQTAWRVWPALGMLALSIETLQGFTIMRDPDWLDLLADLSGASAGVVLAWCVASLSRRLRWRVRAAL